MNQNNIDKKMVRMGKYIALRDLLKFLSIIAVGISSGVFLGATILNTLDKINPLRCKCIIIIGLILGYISLKLDNKIRKMRKDILKFKD